MGAPSPWSEEEEAWCLRGAPEPSGLSCGPAPLPRLRPGARPAPRCLQSTQLKKERLSHRCSTLHQPPVPPESRAPISGRARALPGSLTTAPNRVSQRGSEGGTGRYPRWWQCTETWGRATSSPGNQQPGQRLLKARTPKLPFFVLPGYHSIIRGFIPLEVWTTPQPCVLPSIWAFTGFEDMWV